MKKVFISFILVSLIALGGCTEELLDSLSSPRATVETVAEANEVLASGSVGPTDSADYYRVNVPSGLSGDLIYFELANELASTNLKLTLYNSSRQKVRESDGPDFFGNPGSGFGSSSLNSQAIRVGIQCRGPCIIAEKGVGTVYLKIESKDGSSVSYDLYSYSDPYRDEKEPENEDCGVLGNSAIVPVPINQEFTGALEAVEDIDCYVSNGNIKSIALRLTSNTTIDVKAEIFTLAGSPHPNSSLNTLRATAGSTTEQKLTISPSQSVIVRVTTDNDRAAPASNSQYKLSFEEP